MARVKIRTLVALAGTEFSLAAGDIWEVDEAVAKARVELGLAEYVDPPKPERAEDAGQATEPERPRRQRGGTTAEVAVQPEPEQRERREQR